MTLETYPQVSVEDCASHPENIDPTSHWVVQNSAEGAPFGAMLVRRA